MHPPEAERGDTDPVVGLMLGDRVREQRDRGRRLGVDVEPGLGKGHEEFAERRDGVDAVDPCLGDGGVRQLGDRALPVGDPVQHPIVEGQQHAVGGGVHVGLQISVAEADGLGERVQGVLAVQVGRIGGTATVGEGDETGIEVRVLSGLHGFILPAPGQMHRLSRDPGVGLTGSDTRQALQQYGHRVGHPSRDADHRRVQCSRPVHNS